MQILVNSKDYADTDWISNFEEPGLRAADGGRHRPGVPQHGAQHRPQLHAFYGDGIQQGAHASP